MPAVAQALLPGLAEAIPEFTTLEPYRDRNFNVWRKHGAHSISSVNPSAFVLQVNGREYGATLFAEAQHLLNHAAEHRAHLLNALATRMEPSPSWLFVTLYYMALFIAMSWTRVANAAVVYLDRDAVTGYCGAAPKRPPGGAFEAHCHVDSKTLATYVTFSKCRASHFHEAVWIAAHRHADDAHAIITDGSKNRKPTDEEILSLRGLELFRGYRFSDPLTWQSRLRNGINYRPGFSYRSVVKHNFLRIASRLAKPRLGGLSDAVTLGERAKTALRATLDPFDAVDDALDLLVAQAHFLEASTESALAEVCRLHDLTSSASTARRAYSRANRPISSLIDVPG